MEASNREKIILLLDYYSRESVDLIESMKNAKKDFQAVVINDDGFLPDGVINVFEYYLGSFGKKVKPLYFNQIQVPDYWEIRSTNTEGSVYDRQTLRGRIFYTTPKNKRYVKVVDWIDEQGRVRCSEHYNKYGFKYAVTTFNKKTQKVNKSYFDKKGREVIVENYVTSDIILNLDGKSLIFKNRTEFVAYLLKNNGWDKYRIFFNSLSIPFFVSNHLDKYSEKKEDVLFWQEPTGNEIPGNMQMIFGGTAKRCQKVVVQNHASYQKLISLGAPKDLTRELGFIYSFSRENLKRPEALICTNTENVEKLSELLEELPQVTFHVTALTEMSQKLLSHERYGNAIMYPNVKMDMLAKLFKQCDLFLDINHEKEIVEATRQAFMNNQLIFAFNETKHSKEYVAEENCYFSADYKSMAERIRTLLGDGDLFEKALKNQHLNGSVAKIEDYNF